MTIGSFASSVLFAFQIVIFLLIWVALLFSIQRVTYLILEKYIPLQNNLHWLGSIVASSSMLFELVHRWDATRDDKCSWMASLFASQCRVSIWSLNPLSVLSSLLGDILVLFARAFGRSSAAFLGSFFDELPWLLAIPSFLIISAILLTAALICGGYSLSIGYGFIKITPVAPPPAKIVSPPEDKQTLSLQPHRIAKMNEMYARKVDDK